MQTSKPALELLTSDAIYRENPTALFHQLCGARPATLLLESADIDSKEDLKSLLLVDSALRITALGDTVTIQALSSNGASLRSMAWAISSVSTSSARPARVPRQSITSTWVL